MRVWYLPKTQLEHKLYQFDRGLQTIRPERRWVDPNVSCPRGLAFCFPLSEGRCMHLFNACPDILIFLNADKDFAPSLAFLIC